MKSRNEALWIPCECGEFYCTLHKQHAYECECPTIDEMDIDPYSEPAPIE